MAKFNFSEIEDAFRFVSSASYGMHTALLCRDTGRILYQSDMSDFDEIEEAEEEPDYDQCIEIPHKNDVGLGRELVFAFAEENLPGEMEHVRRMFKRPGAFARFRDLLLGKGLLDKWHRTEEAEDERALREWCADNDIELEK